MSGFFTWGRIGALAGVGLAAAGVTYLLRTEKGRAILDQARAKALAALEKARGGTTQPASEALQPATTTPALDEPTTQPAT